MNAHSIPSRIATEYETALPEWCNNPIGRELVSAIISDPPEGRLIRDDWGTRDHRSFAGKIAGRLRQLHTEWRQREFSKCDREFAITGVWNQRRANEVCGAPDSNQLIERLLAEAEQGQAVAA
jgi:hypothetical protein